MRPKRLRLPPPTDRADLDAWIRDVTNALADVAFSLRTTDSSTTFPDGITLIESTASNVTITLPSPGKLPGQWRHVKNSSNGALNVNASGGATIDSYTTIVVLNDECYAFYSDSSNWKIGA